MDVAVVPAADGGLLEGWVLTGPDEAGYYDAIGAQPIEFGNSGLLFHVTVSDFTEKRLEIPLAFDDSFYTGGKGFTYPNFPGPAHSSGGAYCVPLRPRRKP